MKQRLRMLVVLLALQCALEPHVSDCSTTFLGIKGKPTLRQKLGGKYVCPSCRTEFKDPVKLGA